jgi:hypothetical protein
VALRSGPDARPLGIATVGFSILTARSDFQNGGHWAEAPAARTEGGGSGAVNGPNDVIASIDRIMAYYARSEPSSPVPILMARAKKLVNADFLTIVRDLAPSGVANVTLIGGLNDES